MYMTDFGEEWSSLSMAFICVQKQLLEYAPNFVLRSVSSYWSIGGYEYSLSALSKHNKVSTVCRIPGTPFTNMD